MKRGETIGFALFVVLALAVAALGTRVAGRLERGGAWEVELNREKTTTLKPATRAKLAELNEMVLVTFAVSPPERMPSDRKDLERRVVDLLEAMRRAAPERFDYLVIDPDSNSELVGFASRRRFSPQRVRTVLGDSWSEREIWSSLSIAYGARPEAVLHGIGPEHLGLLQDTLMAQLEELEAPRRPRIALATPNQPSAVSPRQAEDRFESLAALLAERGTLQRVDLNRPRDEGGDPWPQDADLLFWMQPAGVDPVRLAELEAFLKRGRSVVIAGNLLRAHSDALQNVDGAPALLLHEGEAKLEPLLAQLGLQPVRGLVCDSRSDALVFGEETLAAPFLLRCIAPNQDFSAWQRLPNGTLLFTAPTPFAIDEDRQRDRRTTARVLATSSDGTWIQEPPLAPGPPLLLSELKPEAGLPVAKQPLVVELVPDDPWRGHCLLLAGSTPFETGMLEREGVAHRNLVHAILDRFCAPERLVIASAARSQDRSLPPLDAATRRAWRALVLGFAPTLLGLVGVVVILRRGRTGRGPARGGSRAGAPLPRDIARGALLPLGMLLALALAFVAPLVARGFQALLPAGQTAALDLTEEGLHGLSSASRAIAQRAGRAGPIDVQLLVSAAGQLPPGLLPRIRRLEETLQALGRAGADLHIERRAPAELSDKELEKLRALGLREVRSTDRAGEELTLRRFTAALLLGRGERTELLAFDDPLAFEELEFRLAFALWRLETGRHPKLAFASDVPRPSAAEAYENFQSKGLFAPTGVDVYSAARARLEGLDLDLVHVNPRAPELSADFDAVLWLQPRRSIAPMLEAATRYLVGGGQLMIAAQHFRVQARQYRGAGFEGVLWPQPQSPDLEHLWLPELGIELVREVLFDARHIAIEIASQVVGRRAGRVFERQEMALPFLIRADAGSFDHGHPITRQLGDQALLYANQIRWDAERLAGLGLSARTLIKSSPDTWSYAWKGGWIPSELLTGPAPQLEGGSDRLGPVPLMVLFEGAFPKPLGHLTLNPPLDETSGEPLPPPDRSAWPTPQPGRLLLLSSSEVFTDGRLLDPDFRGDHLLVNSALFLALPEELSSIALRRDVPRGFGQVSEGERSRWRALVLASGPLWVCGVTLVWVLLRRRPGGWT